jgi:hypothetical protein
MFNVINYVALIRVTMRWYSYLLYQYAEVGQSHSLNYPLQRGEAAPVLATQVPAPSNHAET